MQEFEQTAMEMMTNLKHRHDQEITDLEQSSKENYMKAYRWSKTVVNMKKQEQIAQRMQDYEQAEMLR